MTAQHLLLRVMAHVLFASLLQVVSGIHRCTECFLVGATERRWYLCRCLLGTMVRPIGESQQVDEWFGL